MAGPLASRGPVCKIGFRTLWEIKHPKDLRVGSIQGVALIVTRLVITAEISFSPNPGPEAERLSCLDPCGFGGGQGIGSHG